MVVCPQFVEPRVSWPSCLSFALQLALVLQVPVGSLLPYCSHLRDGVEASLSSIGTKVWCVSLSLLGCFFMLSLPFVLLSPYGSGVLVGSRLCVTNGCRWCFALSPSGWASNLCLRFLLAPCNSWGVSWWSPLRPRIFGCP